MLETLAFQTLHVYLNLARVSYRVLCRREKSAMAKGGYKIKVVNGLIRLQTYQC
jgi:hypothetical protein